MSRAGALPAVHVEHHDGWAEIRLNRPETRNALSGELVDDLVEALASVAAGAAGAIGGPSVAVLSAAGPTFCAGGDRADLAAGRPTPIGEVVAALNETPLFVIAEVAGDVYGAGIAMLAACPVVLCSTGVSFVLPAAATRDIFPAAFFPYLGGAIPDRALLALGLRSEPLDAVRAANYGMITTAVAPEDLRRETQAWIEVVWGRPQAATAARRHWKERVLRELPAYLQTLH